jgi:hypothetical protein
MHLEKKVESVLKATIASGVSGLIAGQTVSVRTYWADTISTRPDAEISLPCIFIQAHPSSRETTQQPQRTVQVDIAVFTQCEDDLDRSDLGLVYSKVRHLVETTAWDFGALVQYGGLEIPSPGESTVDELNNRNLCAFSCNFILCAESSEAHA